jgi:hypothetical protein
MLATKNEIMHFFEEDGFLQTLWIAWEGNEEDYWDAIDKILTKVWMDYGVERGYVSYEDIEEIRDVMIGIIETLNNEMNPEPETVNMHTDMIGDFDLSLNEARTKEMSETDIRRIVKDEMKKALQDYSKKRDTADHLTKEEVKKMIRKTIVNQYKYLWEKSAFFINNI